MVLRRGGTRRHAHFKRYNGWRDSLWAGSLHSVDDVLRRRKTSWPLNCDRPLTILPTIALRRLRHRKDIAARCVIIGYHCGDALLPGPSLLDVGRVIIYTR